MKTEEELDVELHDTLVRLGKDVCPSCGKAIDRGDVSWNERETEVGSTFTWSQIQCQQCDTEIAHWDSWAGAETFEEFVRWVLSDLER